MAVRDWANDADYAYVDELDLSGLAWEFARRSPELRAELATASPDLTQWGLAATADPELTAQETEVWWSWEAAPAVCVRLASSPIGVERAKLEGMAVGGAYDRLLMPDGLQIVAPTAGSPLAVLLPLDAHIQCRTAAALRLHRGLTGGWSALQPPPRWRRGRLRQLLRAFDARAAGASYRDIARHVLRERFADSAEWKSSSARGLAIRLVRVGRNLVRGGYLRFLGYRTGKVRVRRD